MTAAARPAPQALAEVLSQVSTTGRILLNSLMQTVGAGGRFSMRIEEVGAIAGVKVRAARNNLAEIQRTGALIQERKGGGCGKLSVYSLNIAAEAPVNSTEDEARALAAQLRDILRIRARYLHHWQDAWRHVLQWRAMGLSDKAILDVARTVRARWMHKTGLALVKTPQYLREEMRKTAEILTAPARRPAARRPKQPFALANSRHKAKGPQPAAAMAPAAASENAAALRPTPSDDPPPWKQEGAEGRKRMAKLAQEMTAAFVGRPVR